eukprot:gene11322-8048_t
MSALSANALLAQLYETIREDKDRLMMTYEDQLSAAHGRVVALQEKCDKWKRYLRKTKDDFDVLQAKMMQLRGKDGESGRPSRSGRPVEPHGGGGAKVTIPLRSPLPLQLVSTTPSTNQSVLPPPDLPMEPPLSMNRVTGEKRKRSEMVAEDATRFTSGATSVKPTAPASATALPQRSLTFTSKSPASSNRPRDTSKENETVGVVPTAPRTSAMPAPSTAATVTATTRGAVSSPTNAAAPPSATAGTAKHVPKFVDVVRGKDARAALPGHTCRDCAAFYDAMVEQGIVNDDNRALFLQSCSRHKAQWAIPDTPDSFWDISVNTPAAWK